MCDDKNTKTSPFMDEREIKNKILKQIENWSIPQLKNLYLEVSFGDKFLEVVE